MSANAEPFVAGLPAGEPASHGWASVAEGLLERIGERLNPILVKETRQALKSRQFAGTFALTLLAGWVWSMLGLAWMGQEASYGTVGPRMFMGYYFILGFPLLVIVPYGAFRSLASEQEDRTYELLSITDLNPRQIISGKLGSALIQMLIYLSAIAPCLGFTYMLRGIDFPTILYMVLLTVLASLGLSAVGLLAGTLSGEKHKQVVMSVLLIVGLLLAFFVSCSFSSQMLFLATIPFESADFWEGNGAFLTAYVTYFALAFFAAVAQITFASENRSTRLRVVMLVQHFCLVAWMAYMAVEHEVFVGGMVLAFLTMIGLHWYFLGAVMTGEGSELSLRVKRSLPQSFLGRGFFTWFNPGPGTGYIFAVAGMLGAVAVVYLTIVIRPLTSARSWSSWGSGEPQCVLLFGVVACSYLVIYLGIGLLLVRMLRKVVRAGLLLGVLMQAILVGAGVVVPLTVQSMSRTWSYGGYSLLQITNPFWTLVHVADQSVLPEETPKLLTFLPAAALAVLLVNIPGIVRELRHVRIAVPTRVVEEDRELAAQVTPPRPPVRISPWDEEVTGEGGAEDLQP